MTVTPFVERVEKMERELVDYYARRAREYDRIYEKPERQEDLARLKEMVREMFRGEEVLEVACGTGYWTEVAAEVARSITAVDINESVLEIARGRPRAEKVRFVRGNVYRLAELEEIKDFNASACLCGFWWSHMPKARVGEFLTGLHGRLRPGAKVLFMDNMYVAQSSTPVSRRDEEGNTYQMRTLEDGSRFEVLKNFPAEEELRGAVGAMPGTLAGSIEVRWLTYYWALSYRLVETGGARGGGEAVH